METFSKVDEFKISITAPTVAPEVMEKDLDTLAAELKQAKDSLVYVQSRHAEEIAPIQATIDRFQKRYDEAVKLGIKAKEKVIK